MTITRTEERDGISQSLLLLERAVGYVHSVTEEPFEVRMTVQPILDAIARLRGRLLAIDIALREEAALAQEKG